METKELNEVETVDAEVVTEAPAVIDDDRNDLVEAETDGNMALGVAAGMLLAGGCYFAYTKAIKPGAKWVIGKVKNALNKIDTDDEEEEQEKPKKRKAKKQKETKEEPKESDDEDDFEDDEEE